MKYWVFQSNQVLGPYGPDDLNGLDTFGAESLVCPEGRRGTSMGDWQRAGMVPDLSAALVKAAQGRSARTPVLTLAGLPAEPTLKDLAALGSLQEKTAMLEDAVLQLQESLRVKDAELSGLHQELAEKDKEAFELKQSVEARKTEAAALKDESADSRRRADEAAAAAQALRAEVDKRRAESAELQSRLEQTEKRVEEVRGLGDALDKAVEAEKKVEHDVETHGATLGELAREIESLRAQLQGKFASAPQILPSAAPAAPAAHFAPPASAAPGVPLPIAEANVHFSPVSTAAPTAPVPDVPALPEPQDFPSREPASAVFAEPAPAPVPAPAPAVELTTLAPTSTAPTPAVDLPEHAPFGAADGMAPLPAFGGDSLPAFAAAAPTFDPLSASMEPPPVAAPEEPVKPAEAVVPSAPEKKSRKPLFLAAGVVVTLFAAAFVVLSGNRRRVEAPAPAPIAPAEPTRTAVPAAPVSVKPVAALPSPSLSVTSSATGGGEGTSAPIAPAAAPDPRQSAIDAARGWTLRDGTTLGEKLEKLSPPSGNLSPWMAEPQTDGVVLVNYFAHASAGGPTVAYEFAVDPAAKTVSGRNSAAKAVLSGRTAAAPVARKTVRIKVRPKSKARSPKSKAAARSVKPTARKDVLSAPGAVGDAPAVANPAPVPAKSAATAKPAAPPKKQESLDDLLKE
ncbi:MAG: hypothetical protein HKL90_15280 [Elusimicrobia bacterium]|nr:hypothetical protein [Elusimicrobiota bacterium]